MHSPTTLAWRWPRTWVLMLDLLHRSHAFNPYNGIVQGCPLSMILLTQLMTAWIEHCQHKVPQATPRNYADLSLTAHGLDHIMTTELQVSISWSPDSLDCLTQLLQTIESTRNGPTTSPQGCCIYLQRRWKGSSAPGWLSSNDRIIKCVQALGSSKAR